MVCLVMFPFLISTRCFFAGFEVMPQVQHPFLFYLGATLGKSPVVVLLCGIACVWGIVNLIRRQRSSMIPAQLGFSLLPGFVAFLLLCGRAGHFHRLASGVEIVKPHEMGNIVNAGLAHGFAGIVGVTLPVMIGVLAMVMSRPGEASVPSETS